MSKPVNDPTQQKEGDASDWVNEPLDERHPHLLAHTMRPFNAEPPNAALRDMITPKGQHYRRQHTPVPVIDPAQYTVSIGLEGEKLRAFGLSELSQYPEREIAVTLMCTGNRRSEFNNDTDGETAGLPWKNGSISTARWAGTPLRDVLIAAGFTPDNTEERGLHFLTFWGLEDYHISIPLSKGFDKGGDVILATKMNGAALPRDHGFPLRVMVPGYVGARSVKWLDRIVLSKEEVKGMHQTGIAYKQLAPNIKEFGDIPKGLVEQMPPVDFVPITSAVTSPEPGAVLLRGDRVEVMGYAYAGAGYAVIRVDVSMDGGLTWNQADVERADGRQGIRSGQAWAWVQWRFSTTVETTGDMKILCKAIDDQYNQQPHDTSPIWNIRGILNTSWGNVNVQVIDKSRL